MIGTTSAGILGFSEEESNYVVNRVSKKVQGKISVKFVKSHPDAKTPVYSSDGAGCFDLYAIEDKTIYTGFPETIRTGIKMEIPEGHVMLLFSRSSHGFKNSLRLANCVGVIDSDYRGEINVRMIKDTEGTYEIQKGHRVGQAMIIPIPSVIFEEVNELSETNRGEGGFGSTGK